MVKDIRHKGSFTAVDDVGESHALYVFVDILDAGTLTNPEAEVEGLQQIKTEDGQPVSRLSKGKYQVSSLPDKGFAPTILMPPNSGLEADMLRVPLRPHALGGRRWSCD